MGQGCGEVLFSGEARSFLENHVEVALAQT